MDKAKYEKPLLVELGFDSEVMGARCKSGPGEQAQCKSGTVAHANCISGKRLGGGDVCSGGGAAVS